VAEIIPFPSMKKKEQAKEEKTHRFFRNQEKFFEEAFQSQKEEDSRELEHFDPARQTGYDLTPDILEQLDEEIKIARKTSMSQTENHLINHDITPEEWEWLQSWLEQKRK